MASIDALACIRVRAWVRSSGQPSCAMREQMSRLAMGAPSGFLFTGEGGDQFQLSSSLLRARLHSVWMRV